MLHTLLPHLSEGMSGLKMVGDQCFIHQDPTGFLHALELEMEHVALL